MNGTFLDTLKMVISGLPNFGGLIIAVMLLYLIISDLLMRNNQLTDALLACAAGH